MRRNWILSQVLVFHCDKCIFYPFRVNPGLVERNAQSKLRSTDVITNLFKFGGVGGAFNQNYVVFVFLSPSVGAFIEFVPESSYLKGEKYVV